MTSDTNFVSILCKSCSKIIDSEVFRADCNHHFCRACKIFLEQKLGKGLVACCNTTQTFVLCGDMSKIRLSTTMRNSDMKRLKKLEGRLKKLVEIKVENENVKMENKQLKEGLASLTDTVVQLKEQLNRKPDDPIDCSDCKECYTEKKMYICKTCSESTVRSAEKNKKKHVLKSIGLCSNCVVMDHIVQKHDVVPLFPVLARMQYKEHVVDIDQMKKIYDEKFTKVAELWKGIEELSDILKKYIDTTTDMIKTSKSSSFQQEIKEFIILKVNEFNDKIGGVEDHLKSDVDKLNEMLTNFNSQVSEMCNDKCTNVDEIINTLNQLMDQQQSIGTNLEFDSSVLKDSNSDQFLW